MKEPEGFKDGLGALGAVVGLGGILLTLIVGPVGLLAVGAGALLSFLALPKWAKVLGITAAALVSISALGFLGKLG